MDSKGNIYNPEAVSELLAKAAGGDQAASAAISALVPIESDELESVKSMNRAQRRAWYSDRRRKNKRFGGGLPQSGR